MLTCSGGTVPGMSSTGEVRRQWGRLKDGACSHLWAAGFEAVMESEGALKVVAQVLELEMIERTRSSRLLARNGNSIPVLLVVNQGEDGPAMFVWHVVPASHRLASACTVRGCYRTNHTGHFPCQERHSWLTHESKAPCYCMIHTLGIVMMECGMQSLRFLHFAV